MERKIINPANFKTAFLSAQVDKAEDLVKAWNNRAQYTSIILNEEQSICTDIKESLRLNYRREYWSLDGVFYTKKLEKKYFGPKAAYAEYIAIAFEHENDFKTSYEEMNKLAIFSSELKVLVTYPEPKDEKELLLEYEDILKKADIFGNFGTLQNYLIIFGFLKKIRKKIDWRFYSYTIKGFEEI